MGGSLRTLVTQLDSAGVDDTEAVDRWMLYFARMNSARPDKQRMLDYAKPGKIVEIGPGGGVVLDLLEERFPASDILGIDISPMVIEALEERRSDEGHRWRVIEGDAFELPKHVGEGGADTVIFCSVLHEIFSYVEPRYRLDQVRRMLAVTGDALAPGGRIIIRDGVSPPDGVRVIEFLVSDGRYYFDRFAAEFEARTIEFEETDDGRVRLSTPDAMEFLYTYTWGPKSFPYEVRERYGIMTYETYRSNVLSWVEGIALVEIPEDLTSYLQPGYRTALEPKIRFTDGDGAPAELPDSNCVLVFERGV